MPEKNDEKRVLRRALREGAGTLETLRHVGPVLGLTIRVYGLGFLQPTVPVKGTIVVLCGSGFWLRGL